MQGKSIEAGTYRLPHIIIQLNKAEMLIISPCGSTEQTITKGTADPKVFCAFVHFPLIYNNYTKYHSVQRLWFLSETGNVLSAVTKMCW